MMLHANYESSSPYAWDKKIFKNFLLYLYVEYRFAQEDFKVFTKVAMATTVLHGIQILEVF